jgi:hypothetical protein
MAGMITLFGAATSTSSVSLKLMLPVPVLIPGYSALNSAMWWASLMYTETPPFQ